MNKQWLACAAALALAAAPVLAQTDNSSGVPSTGDMSGAGAAGATDTTGGPMAGMNMAGGHMTTNVDVGAMRSNMDRLRGFLDNIQENSRLGNSLSDFVHQDVYRRANEILLDNARSVAIRTVQDLGDPVNIPTGLGEVRDHLALVASHLNHAALVASYDAPIQEAKNHLDMAYQALDRNSASLTGASGAGSMGGTSGTMGNMGNMGNMGGMSNGTSGNTGTSGNAGGMNNSTTDPTQNQSNPALNNYNSTNPAGAGNGGVAGAPNTTPGQTGPNDAAPTGSTGTDNSGMNNGGTNQ